MTRSTRIRATPKPTEEQLKKLGKFPPPTAISEQMAVDHFPLAQCQARSFARRTRMPYDDLLLQAWVGLLNAARRFEPERGLKFSTIAVPFIQGSMKRWLRDRGHAIKFPHAWRDVAPRVRLLAGEGKTSAAIAERLGILRSEVEEILTVLAPMSELHPELHGADATIEYDDDDLYRRDLIELAERAFSELSWADRSMLEAWGRDPGRYGFPSLQLQQFQGRVRAIVGQKLAPGGMERTPLGFEVDAAGVSKARRVAEKTPRELMEQFEQLGLGES